MTEVVDTGFDAVLAGEVYVHPDLSSPAVSTVEPANPPEVLKPEITATVNEPLRAPNVPQGALESTGLTPDGVQALKSLLKMPVLTPPALAQLAREFAMDLKERHVILADYKLTEAQFEFLEAHNDFFKQAYHAACIEWHAPLSTPERIKVEAAAILEDSLIGLGGRMQNRGEGLPGVIEAAKLFAKIAGVGERETSGAAPGERFTINIDLGGDQKINISTTAAPALAADGPVQLARPSDGGT